MRRAQIVGTGMAVPEKVLSNADLEKIVDTTDEWILARTGIRERRMAAEDEALSDFAIPAARRALEMAGVPGTEVQLVICATVTGDMTFPATAAAIQHAIGAPRATAFDLGAACTGFIYGLEIADQMIRGGSIDTAVVVGGEMLTKFVDWTDRRTCVLFGDGAGAVVLRATEEDRGVLAVSTYSDGSLGDLIYRPGGGSRHPAPDPSSNGLNFIQMRGNETFKIAVRSLAEVSDEVLTGCGLRHRDVDWFIPHQANRRIIDAVGKRLEVPEGRTYVNIERYGNTSAASIPIALDELVRSGQVASGNHLLFSAFGSGLTWGAGVVRW
ncbi:MAG: beta-ketoacyl-ACP synthase III [Thermoanaerobaculia bacterium]|nr:beta-ketoacyl-ACP synthase III [Thermoanaerobaculia bacterium]